MLTVILWKDYETTGRRKIAEIKADAQARMPAVGGAEMRRLFLMSSKVQRQRAQMSSYVIRPEDCKIKRT